MTLISSLIAEIGHEASNTEKMLARVPADKFDWRPHEKSMTLKHLAAHVADLAGWPAFIVKTQFLDFANNNLERPVVESTEDLLALLKKGTEESVEALKNVTEEDLEGNWILRNGEHIIIDMPKAAVIRNMALNHIYHHRAQLGVYLRLLDVPVPGMYGPSADDVA
ncbi:MAG TPA: DinB family protein [Edaphocola sp.]|nr:DinB family protein [Edaphocola sp.]